MVKIVHPVAHELAITRCKLEEANQQLAAARDEIAILKDEVARLHRHVPLEFKEKPQSPANTSLPSHHKNIDLSTPRYARPTQASEKRFAKSTTQTQPPITTSAITLTLEPTSAGWGYQWDCTGAPFPNKYQYRDGSLVKLPIGYLNTTRSFSTKQRPKPLRLTVESKTESSEIQSEECSSSSRVEGSSAQSPDDGCWRTDKLKYFRTPWSLSWLHYRQELPRKLSDTEYRDFMDLQALVPATRLNDDKWLNSPLKYMLIDDGQQARLLTQGREMAQKCLWNFAEKRMPGKNPWTEWRHVRFEWGVLSTTWGSQAWHGYYGLLNFRASEAALVWHTMQDVIRLRHTTSHYNPSSGLYPFTLSRVDEHLKNVQKMAIQFYDEQGALEVRRLRDELRQAAQDTFDELVDMGTLLSLPFAGYPWKNHHERVLRDLCTKKTDADVGRARLDEHFPGQVGRIAEDWSCHHNWDGGAYEPPVCVTACPRTRPKRRHSTSSRQDSGVVTDLIARIKADREWEQRNGPGTPYDVPKWLIEAHEQGETDAPSRVRRRLSCSS